jgi:DNA-binding transcriptional MerR regulator
MNALMTVADVARKCGVTPASVRAWERLGKLPAMRTEGGVRLFRPEDVQRILRTRAASASTEAA